MPNRFVILFHATGENDHLDLLLELEPEAPLATWQLSACGEQLDTLSRAAAVRLPDHRRVYLTYEGAISGNRGHVRRVDEGTFALLAQTPEKLELQFQGQHLRGAFALERTSGSDWTFTRTTRQLRNGDAAATAS